MHTGRARVRGVGDDGMTLVEGLISILILGITTAALLTGILAFVTNSSRHRGQATANAILVSATEALLDPARTAYVSNCNATPYSTADALDGVTLPSGWTNANVVITGVRYWNGTQFQSTCYDRTNTGSTCPAVDDRAKNFLCRSQEITVRVSSPDGKASVSLAVVKRGS